MSERIKFENGVILEDPAAIETYHCIEAYDFMNTIPWDDGQLGNLYAACYKEHVCYSLDEGKWYYFNGAKWMRDVNSVKALDNVERMYQLLECYSWTLSQTDEKTKEFKKWINKMSCMNYRRNVLASACDPMGISSDKFDTDNTILCTPKGVYKEGTIRNHLPDDYNTLCTVGALHSDSKAACPLWEKTVRECLVDEDGNPSEELADYFKRCLGYSLFGLNRQECMFIAYGVKTRNGKGTLLNTFLHVLGDYGNNAPVTLITGQSDVYSNPDKPNAQLVKLKHARFVTMSEPDENTDHPTPLNSEAVKGLTGRDPISTRLLHSNTVVTYEPRFVMWLSCNSLPQVSDLTVFDSDRIFIVPFNRHFSDDERDLDLKDKLKAEADGILQWAIDGYRDYIRIGINPPKCAKRCLSAYRTDNDRIYGALDYLCGNHSIPDRISAAELKRMVEGHLNAGLAPYERKKITTHALNEWMARHHEWYTDVSRKAGTPIYHGVHNPSY